MQTQNLPRSPAQGRLISIALVAAIHIAAIMALIAALDPSLIPRVAPGGPIEFVAVKSTPPTRPPLDIPTRWTTPTAPVDRLPPRVDMQDNTTATNPPPDAGTGSSVDTG